MKNPIGWAILGGKRMRDQICILRTNPCEIYISKLDSSIFDRLVGLHYTTILLIPVVLMSHESIPVYWAIPLVGN